ncbi:hypothetical protein A264_17124 [Pseudomonas syringae pv. actinidiae ICMP 19071]|uniref:hypothetical protein n=1 Tax=Pseudomonas syringae TaxID=317 RepID=UPI00035831BA|nr:hypothetical protein [Pseudomonas syringae]EPM58209.1 hypothetical protein A264_17124 [Pseudomonas syringae pv. actinidiae ICMP 19071]EPM59192.1 hypothetical protein A262_10347 [Pseudomonas syringae pv. actinidiae ICMP 19073]EPM76858.1 hypothetical protein A3SO_16537 [Pseudomonas syringae pv. actinidiae ICMP 19072]OSN68149.1 hypothetical protein BV349_01256 [Pseudomonas syringae pv. actinidiae]OSN78446.1 hypothetical protein BV351_01255 [Pseudomonas syringae pv. actinidiae]
MRTDQTKLLALTLLEIKTLLADYLGRDVEAPMSVRVAAHMAYALHNEAEAVYNNADFEIADASLKIYAIDQILGVTDGASLLDRFNVETKNILNSGQPR